MTKQITEQVEILSIYDFGVKVSALRNLCDMWIDKYGENVTVDLDFPISDNRIEVWLSRMRPETSYEEAKRKDGETIRDKKLAAQRKIQYEKLKKEFGDS